MPERLLDRLLRRPGRVSRRPRVAVLTVARDEAALLPRWVAHYGAQVGLENLQVFDDGSSDGGTEALPCPVRPVRGFRPGRFESDRIRLVSDAAAGLLASYDVVVFTDVDELLLPDPALHAGLVDYLAARRDVPVMAPLALNVVQHVDLEGPLDPSRPVLGQRSFAKFAPVMCKPALKRVPAPWTAASHGVRAAYRPDPELFMVHLKFADRDALQRQADRRHALATSADGRGRHASWSRTGNELVRLVEEVTHGIEPATVPEFDPAGVDLDALVLHEGAVHRAPRRGQVGALRARPLVRVPARLHGLV